MYWIGQEVIAFFSNKWTYIECEMIPRVKMKVKKEE